jgi:hypothetical protein
MHRLCDMFMFHGAAAAVAAVCARVLAGLTAV